MAYHGLGRQAEVACRLGVGAPGHGDLHELIGAQAVFGRGEVGPHLHGLVARAHLRHDGDQACGCLAALHGKKVARAQVVGLIGCGLQGNGPLAAARHLGHGHPGIQALAGGGGDFQHRARRTGTQGQARLQRGAGGAGASHLQGLTALAQSQLGQFVLGAAFLYTQPGNDALSVQFFVAFELAGRQPRLGLGLEQIALPCHQLGAQQAGHGFAGPDLLASAHQHLLHHAGHGGAEQLCGLRGQFHGALQHQAGSGTRATAAHHLRGHASRLSLCGGPGDRRVAGRGRGAGRRACRHAQRGAKAQNGCAEWVAKNGACGRV